MAILPGATIGILGGGQLGRMAGMAARSLGYGVLILDPDPACAAAAVADHTITASFDDANAASELARGSTVVTFEIERISAEALRAAAAHAPLRPGAHVLEIVQDRALQKRWLVEHGFPVGPYREAGSVDELGAAVRALGGPGRAKVRSGGYDGRGQARVADPTHALHAWTALGRAPCVVERELELAAELSVMVARRPSGETAVFPAAQNWHTDGILSYSVIPGALPAGVADAAERTACGIADALVLEGLLAVEFFFTRAGELLVNELSPRPHNTFHATETACATSQFEQLVRAVCDLPLGSTELVRPTALANVLGDLWMGHEPPGVARALALPGVRLHLYGKAPRKGRKIGHLLAPARSSEEAIALVQKAWRALAGEA